MHNIIIYRAMDGSESIYVDAFARGVRRSYVECCSMINRVPEVEVADPVEVAMAICHFLTSVALPFA